MHPESGDHGAAPALAAGSAVDGNVAAQLPADYCRERLDDRPGCTDHRLFVAHLDIASGEK
jgi:hypothetical protein